MLSLVRRSTPNHFNSRLGVVPLRFRSLSCAAIFITLVLPSILDLAFLAVHSLLVGMPKRRFTRFNVGIISNEEPLITRDAYFQCSFLTVYRDCRDVREVVALAYPEVRPKPPMFNPYFSPKTQNIFTQPLKQC